MSGHFRKGRKTLAISAVLTVFLFFGFLGGTSGGGILYCQTPGIKFFKNFSPEDYMLHHQNWSITQGHHGIIYVGNHGNLMEYDGISWRHISIPNDTVRSLAVDESGTIYVGGINDFGFLAPGSYGQTTYISLLEHLDAKITNFSNVWRTHAVRERIYFRTAKYVFCWNPEKKTMAVDLKCTKGNEFRFNGSYTCSGKLFIKQRNVGLLQKKGNSYKLIPGGETFAPIGVIFMVVPYDDSGEKFLIGTREKGFFIYDGKSVEHFPTEIERYLKEKKASYGIKLLLSPGYIAIATLRGGLVITDLQGRLKNLFTKETGLLDNNVKYVFEDAQGNLWTALNTGIAKIEYSSPLSIYNDEHSHLPGVVYSVTRLAGRLYSGTSEGLFYSNSDNNKFSHAAGMSSACWSLLSIDDSILSATETGVYQLKDNTIRKITSNPSYVLLRSRHSPQRIWVGMRDSLCSIHLDQEKGKRTWQEERKYKRVAQEVRTIIEDNSGNLWLGVIPSGIIRVNFPVEGSTSDYVVTRFNTTQKLPEGEVRAFWADSHVLFGPAKGLLRFKDDKNLFIPDYTLGQEFSKRLEHVFRMVEDKNNSIWLHAGGLNFLAVKQRDRTYKIEKKFLARIPIGWQVNAIFPDLQQEVTWFATNKGLVRFDTGLKKNYDYEFNTIIRRVYVNGNTRFYNYKPIDIRYEKKETGQPIPILKYNERNIRFEFAAPFFEAEKRTTFFCKLENYDKEWIKLQSESFKDYTHLDAGLHTFRVKAKNVYGNSGREAMFRFRVRPPWYMTWWAYLLYAGLFSLIIFLLFQWRLTQSKREKKRLEQIVNKRTKEINHKNQQLEKQTVILKEQAEKLKELDHAKSRFFTNISHEFRTPLTLIIGPLEHILSRTLPQKFRDKLNLIYRNSHRLQTLINRLLDLSRIDSGKMRLKAAPQDIVSFLKGIIATFEQLIRQNELEVEFHSPAESIILFFDDEKLDEVFCNLVTNAIKFSPEKGKITISVKKIAEEEAFPSGAVEVSVKDTGIGIPKEQLAHIFDRFFQVESHERKNKGSGIGLALARELVTLHHGKIDVNSRIGENSGTEFILRFPLGKKHLEPGEIAAPLETGILSQQDKKQLLPDDEDAGDEFIERSATAADDVTKRYSSQKYHCEKTRFSANSSIEEGFADEELKGMKVVEEDTGARAPEKEQAVEKSTILIVEDNPDMRRFICESIETWYNVEEAGDGEEGIRIAREIMPDLIISDIMMPKVDGYELCRALKEDIETSHLPVILLTAKASQESVVSGLETGADDYITKPFNEKILLARIKNLIDLRRELQEKFQRQMVLQPEEIQVSTTDQRFLEKLHKIIEEDISDPDLNVEGLSKKMNISRVTLNRKIHAFTGETATDFIRSYRLKRAVQLLKENFGTVLEISIEVGFSSSAYFTKCFREKFHRLPSAFLGKPPAGSGGH